ncbi:MAG: iron ABC transporter permease, partial [Anaerolineae bacterium]|nr:iron ABC transporter permease [Anaerolineae bacterium]
MTVTVWRRHLFALLLALGLLTLILSIFIGRFPQPYWMPPTLLQENELARQLVLNLRLPRLLAALMLGMALGGAGAVMQMIFRNPLVEPGFLGVSQGAGFGAALAIIKISNAPLVVAASAAGFAFLGLMFSYALAR